MQDAVASAPPAEKVVPPTPLHAPMTAVHTAIAADHPAMRDKEACRIMVVPRVQVALRPEGYAGEKHRCVLAGATAFVSGRLR